MIKAKTILIIFTTFKWQQLGLLWGPLNCLGIHRLKHLERFSSYKWLYQSVVCLIFCNFILLAGLQYSVSLPFSLWMLLIFVCLSIYSKSTPWDMILHFPNYGYVFKWPVQNKSRLKDKETWVWCAWQRDQEVSFGKRKSGEERKTEKEGMEGNRNQGGDIHQSVT